MRSRCPPSHTRGAACAHFTRATGCAAQGLALASTRLLAELREARQESEYCAHVPAGLPAKQLELDCAEVGGRVGRRLASGVARLLSMWAAAFVAYRLSEIMQEKDVSSEDARLVALILRVKSELQESATEFEEFICKRLDDVEHAMPARGGAHQVVYR